MLTRPHFRAELIPGEGVSLVSDGWPTLLRGHLYELVAPWLGGRSTADEVCERLRDRASPAEVYFTLGQLEQKEYLCDGDSALTPGHAALWSSQKILPAIAGERLAAKPIAVRSLGVEPAGFLELLAALHVHTTQSTTRAGGPLYSMIGKRVKSA